jgi:hypothetical protein
MSFTKSATVLSSVQGSKEACPAPGLPGDAAGIMPRSASSMSICIRSYLPAYLTKLSRADQAFLVLDRNLLSNSLTLDPGLTSAFPVSPTRPKRVYRFSPPPGPSSSCRTGGGCAAVHQRHSCQTPADQERHTHYRTYCCWNPG